MQAGLAPPVNRYSVVWCIEKGKVQLLHRASSEKLYSVTAEAELQREDAYLEAGCVEHSCCCASAPS